MSNTRNGLLAQIVQASGGTVTDASNRNSLLQDWLNAVSGPVGRWYFNFNGVDQYVQMSTINLSTGDTLEFKIKSPSQIPVGTDDYFIGSSLATNKLAVRHHAGTGRLIWTGNATATFDGSPITTLFILPLDGATHTIVLTATQSCQFDLVGCDNYTSFGVSPIFDIKVNDGSVYNFPLDDSFANNPVARNTGSGANGTYINATEASWSFE
jgi:hypothetical protein